MKETIKFYYNVFVEKIYEISNGCYFYYSNFKYYFISYDSELNKLEELFKISNDLYNKSILVNTFILTKDNKYYVEKESRIYVLLRVNSIEEDIISISELIEFNNSVILNNNIVSWSSLWGKNIDMFESEISELNTDYPLIQSTFDYYVGIAENAISYVNNTFLEEDINSFRVNLNHKRINECYQGYINNPLTFTFDYSVRDIAEYTKYNFFNNSLNISELESILLSSFSKGEIRLYYARLMYPTYYFDMVKDIFIYDKSEDELSKYIDKIEEYEYFLQDIYYILKKKFNIPPVEWVVNRK